MGKTKSINLIEILFIIAIGAVIIVTILRYSGISNRSIRVAHAIKQINILTKASYEWLDSQNQDDFSDSSGGRSISLQQLIDDGFIKKANHLKDPWKGKITIQPGSDPKRIQITLTQIPQRDCKDLAKHLDKDSKITMPGCSKSINNYSGEF